MLLNLSSRPAFVLVSSDSRRRLVAYDGRHGCGARFTVFSSHSNVRFVKPSRRSRRDWQASIYVDDDDDDEEEDDDESELLDLAFSEFDEFGGNHYSRKRELKLHSGVISDASGMKISTQKAWETELKKSVLGPYSMKTKPSKTLAQNSHIGYDYLAEVPARRHVDSESECQKNTGKFTKNRFQKLVEEMDFVEKWFPLIDYLSTFGLKESHFLSIYDRHMPSFQISLAAATERLTFLIGVGVKRKDIKRMLVRQPQILEYSVENNMIHHVRFLNSIGIPSSRIGRIISAAPSLFSYNVEHSLKPKIRYLVEEVGVKASDVTKIVQLSPQVLVQRIDASWTSRSSFLSKELGAPRDNIVKMVTKHPQLLHYSIEDGILPRINFLRSIGMSNSDIVKVLTSLTQVLSLSLEDNLKPKYLYLVNELKNEVQSLTKYPMYLSLSLDQRIRPRHEFLLSLKKIPNGPFPLGAFVPTDERFCQQWAGTSLDKYLAFRQSLLRRDFAIKR
ncbi:hypothetical protein HPP92_007746 [Vanilla planifolia]|uniref:Transcription termination factor MTERF9, chloroplastic n=1 Tax=Vanilla planifolia TaxID=51239 RepID=A0A835VAZ1_VANPL|nr:hypothetical protein HPP92_007883 [Vanilla planifolia]KAG0490883.1 hypothetical protein HPP92_007746 [Vanilla planifolia]